MMNGMSTEKCRGMCACFLCSKVVNKYASDHIRKHTSIYKPHINCGDFEQLQLQSHDELVLNALGMYKKHHSIVNLVDYVEEQSSLYRDLYIISRICTNYGLDVAHISISSLSRTPFDYGKDHLN